jgi:putative Holliday junction resolvase
MNKIMSLDIGTKRIGVALSDFLHILAAGNCAVQRIPENEAVEKIKQIAYNNNVKKIIIGLPFNMDGSEGGQAQDCKKFANYFNDEFEVIFEDERLTSMQAEENLRNKKIDFRKNKELVDIESACIILEQYLCKI